MHSRTLAALVATGAFLVPVGAAVADSPNNPKADIQQGNLFCGADLPAAPVLGFTNYHRVNETTILVNYHLKDAEPNTEYTVQLWGSVCSFFGQVDVVTTNKGGVANGNGTVTVPAGETRFFATAWDGTTFHDTPAVTVP